MVDARVLYLEMKVNKTKHQSASREREGESIYIGVWPAYKISGWREGRRELYLNLKKKQVAIIPKTSWEITASSMNDMRMIRMSDDDDVVLCTEPVVEENQRERERENDAKKIYCYKEAGIREAI